MRKKLSAPICISVAIICMLPCVSSAGKPRGPDFNFDSFDDLAIGAAGDEVNGDDAAGAVAFVYGGNSGLHEPVGSTDFLYQDFLNIEEDSDPGDEFGKVMAWGDFDGDCHDDLVVGIGNETVGGDAGAGLIQVFYSDGNGPSAVDELWSRDTGTMAETADANDHFGAAVAVGDFNGDGYDDVVVGVPGDDDTASAAGSIHVLYGSASGLDDANNTWFNQASSNVEGSAEPGDSFGSAVAAGDFNCDGYEDVAIGVTGENTNAGAVQIIYGSSGGLSATAGPSGDVVFLQGETDIKGSATPGDRFGQVLVTGNFDNNSNNSNNVGCQDLAVGIPMEDGAHGDDGAVQVFYGTAASGIQFTSPEDDLWHQDVGSIADDRAELEFFGYSLVVGEMDNDGYDDLAIGVPNEIVENMSGAVHIIRGGSGGLVDTSNVLLTQEFPGVGGVNVVSDSFGEYLGFGSSFDVGNSIGALVVGAPGEDHSAVTGAGLTYVIYLDNTSTPTIAYTEIWDQNNIDGVNEAGDAFGTAFVPTRDVPWRCIM